MKKFFLKTSFCSFLICIAFSSCTEKQSFAQEDNLKNFFQKKEVTIVVTDSGLGGLSILAESAEKMKEKKMFNHVHFIFFNSLFSMEGGYNSLKTPKEKILIFDSALKNLSENYDPDLIQYIEKGTASNETEMLIFAYTDEAFLNPNSNTTYFLFKPGLKNRVKNTDIDVCMISMVKIGEEELDSIGQRLADLSPQTAMALQNYELKEDLFAWKEFVTSKRLIPE